MGRRNRDLQRERRMAAARAGQRTGPSDGAASPAQRRAVRRAQSAPNFAIDLIGILGLGLLFIFLLREAGVTNDLLTVVVALVAAKLIVSFLRYKFS